jgi:hypothetical protein
MATVTTAITTRLDKEISNIVKRSSIDKKFVPDKKAITYSEFLSNKMLMIFVIREGVPYSLFNLIQHLTPFTDDNWAEFLDISPKSLHRYKHTSKRFKSIQSEKIIQ